MENSAAAIVVYAKFAAEWEATTGVRPQVVESLAQRFRDGIASRLPAHLPQPQLVSDASEIPEGAIVLFGCSLGVETASTFAASRPVLCSPAPLWDWVTPKYPYMRALVTAGIAIPPTWHVHSTAEGVQAVDLLKFDVCASGEAATTDHIVRHLVRAHPAALKLVVKQCCALGGALAVEVLDAAAAASRAVELAVAGGDVLLQPDLSADFAVGETKCCVRVGRDATESSVVLGARHAPPGCEFGTLQTPDALPPALKAVAGGAADVLRDFALGAGVAPPPMVRVDCIEVSGDWTVNEFELCDYGCWMWGWACDGREGEVDSAVCAAHAHFSVAASERRSSAEPMRAAP